MLTIALPKGRLADQSIDLLLAKKWVSAKPPENTRELSYIDPVTGIKLLFVKSQDVPVYVEECAADAGIAGWDVLLEGNFDVLVPVDLEIGKCRLSVAGKKDFKLSEQKNRKLRVATKYTNLTRKFFFEKGLSCEIIKLYGSIELAPLCGMSDCIVDLVETGTTLKTNGLQETETIIESSARLIFNRSSFYLLRREAGKLIQDMSQNNS